MPENSLKNYICEGISWCEHQALSAPHPIYAAICNLNPKNPATLRYIAPIIYLAWLPDIELIFIVYPSLKCSGILHRGQTYQIFWPLGSGTLSLSWLLPCHPQAVQVCGTSNNEISSSSFIFFIHNQPVADLVSLPSQSIQGVFTLACIGQLVAGSTKE